MRRLLLCLLLCAAPAFGAQKYLDPTGSDSNDGSSGSPWLTLQKALDTMTSSDDLIIRAGTYTGAAVRTSGFGGTSSDQMIIEGDSGAARSAVIIDGNSASAAIQIGATSPSTAHAHYLTLKHFTIRNADDKLIYYPNLETGQTGLVIQDIYFDDNPGTLCCSRAAGAQPEDAWALMIGRGYNTQILDNVFEGDPAGTTVQGITGSNSGVIFLAGNNTTGNSNLVQGNTGSNWLGGFVREGSRYARIRNNTLTDLLCATDDGCVQVYNDYGNVISGNVFWDVCVWSSAYSFVAIRSTPGATCQSSFHASASVYNNTLKLRSSCSTAAGGRQRAIWRNNLQCQNGTINEDIVMINNLLIGGWYDDVGIGGDGSVTYSDSTPLCPASPHILRVDHNMFYQTGDMDVVGTSAAATCTIPVTLGTGDVSGTDPNLDGSYAPQDGGNAVCGGATDYTDYDGVASFSWIGAKQGACGGGAGPATPAVKLYGAIINGGRIP